MKLPRDLSGAELAKSLAALGVQGHASDRQSFARHACKRDTVSTIELLYTLFALRSWTNTLSCRAAC